MTIAANRPPYSSKKWGTWHFKIESSDGHRENGGYPSDGTLVV